MKGYVTDSGYMGYVDGRYILFPVSMIMLSTPETDENTAGNVLRREKP